MNSLEVYAGQQAYAHIQEHGLSPSDIRVIIGASGGPKWFVLSHLDRYLVQHWLPKISHPIDLIGSSIGAWRMSAYASSDGLAALELLEENYLTQSYSEKPTAREVTQSVHCLVDGFIAATPLSQHTNRNLHIVTARCKGLAQYELKPLQAIAMMSVALSNAAARRSLPLWFDRVIFNTANSQLPIERWDNFKTTTVTLSESNYRSALLASGAIPVVIEGVRNPSGAPVGMYRDGGMVDYHFDLPLKPKDGLVLYPHFAPMLKPGWFDKPLPWRRVSADHYSQTVVVTPSQEFIESLPFGKIPDRRDFERLATKERIQYWRTVVDRNKALADAFDHWTAQPNMIDFVKPISALTSRQK